MSIAPDSRFVAIIDDDDSVRRALQDLIETEGLATLCFHSAEQFLDFEARHQAACVICDIRMPGMSGLGLQSKVKAERFRVSIIFITAHGNTEMRTRALRDGASGVLNQTLRRLGFAGKRSCGSRKVSANRRLAQSGRRHFVQEENNYACIPCICENKNPRSKRARKVLGRNQSNDGGPSYRSAGGLPVPGYVLYSATKGAVDTITVELSLELAARKIRVNAIAPGAVETEGTNAIQAFGGEFGKQIVAMTPLGRIGQPRDIAKVALFLASEDSEWLTGEKITASGGRK